MLGTALNVTRMALKQLAALMNELFEVAVAPSFMHKYIFATIKAMRTYDFKTEQIRKLMLTNVVFICRHVLIANSQ